MIVPAALECRDLSAGYDKLVVVRKLDIAVRHKEILAVLGPNGAGKTTLLMTLAGFLAPAGGTIMMDGAAMRCGSARRANRAGIVLVPDNRALFTELTPVQNLQLAARRGGPSVTEVLDLFPALRRRAKLRVGDLSGGEQQMLALGRAMMSEPALLCLDEPSLGLAPRVVRDIFRTIRTINQAGVGVLLVEQNARYALDTASRGYVLQTGRIIASGPCAALREDARLREAYLGRASV
jgi:branched-chain amino acid transport system ATP-binding protein